jgi:glycosyltransferase involved in cell wall biosynthesis
MCSQQFFGGHAASVQEPFMQSASKPVLDVAVVMPSFNRAALVTRALDSVLGQRVRPRELILVDDASTDATVQVVQDWSARTGFPVRIERLATNGGVAAARNRGIFLARSRYIAFLDTDDEHLPHTLQKLVRALDAHPGAVVAFGDGAKVMPSATLNNAMFRRRVNLAEISEPAGAGEETLHRLRDAKTVLLGASIIPTCASCFRREDALAIGGMPHEYRTGEDWMFWLRLCERGEFVFYLEDLARVHRHAGNLTHPGRAAETSRQKLIGYRALLDGQAGVSLSAPQRRQLEELVRQRGSEWRYQASRLGMAIYLRELRKAKLLTGTGPLAHTMADPKSLLRALRYSFGREEPLAAD